MTTPSPQTPTVRSAQEREPGAVAMVRKALVDYIRDRGMSPGDSLPSEGEFAIRLGVSRPVVREAFSSLAALKLIDVGGGRRARIASVDDTVLAVLLEHAVGTRQISVQQILDVRRTVEIRTAELAALRRSDREAEEISAHANAMRVARVDPERVMEHDISFHESIAAASKNPLFALVVGSFHLVTLQTWPIGWAARRSEDEHIAAIVCHEEIAGAIADREPQTAAARMAEHFDMTARALLAGGIN